MNINDIEEIIVKLSNGDSVIYRGRGLEKFRRIMANSKPLGQDSNVMIVESVSDDEIHSDPKTKQKTKNDSTPNTGSYATANLQYSTPAKGRSAVDIAREMQQHAEKLSGIKF